MCRFLSAVFLKTGEVLCDPDHTDSHEHLIAAANVRDGEVAFFSGNLCRVEFAPPDDTKLWGDMTEWTLWVDEKTTPDWFDAEKARAILSARIERMFIRDRRGTLLGGCWILDGDRAHLGALLGGRIVGVINGANLKGAHLACAYMARAKLVGANMERACMAGANLVFGDMRGANLGGADLEHTNLAGANLMGANLTVANLASAYMRDACMDGANLHGAHMACSYMAVLPEGWETNEEEVCVRKANHGT
jgi:hypothetical protein